MLIELLLQALIGQVDTQLLKAVLLEAFKAVDVQDADRALRALPRACNDGGFVVSFQLDVGLGLPVYPRW